jgi:predicted RNase H-like nuclease
LQHIAIRNLSIREVDALVCAAPLESRVHEGNPLLVFAPLDTRPNLKLRAIGIDAVLHVDALEIW